MNRYLPQINKTPVIERTESDLSPEDIFRIFRDIPRTAFLNGSLAIDTGRYSYIGIAPFLTVSSKKGSIRLDFDGHSLAFKGDPLTLLDTVFEAYRTDTRSDLPFTAGCIGYFSYDLKDILETLPDKALDDLNMPDMYFSFYRGIIIMDRLDPGQLYICETTVLSDRDKNSGHLLDFVKKRISSERANDQQDTGVIIGHRISSNFSRTGYISSVEKVIDYIREGDIYQACLSQRFHTTSSIRPYTLYSGINRANPSPFSAFLDQGDLTIASFSPELFVNITGDDIETRPMKGTRPRGKNDEEDGKLKADLTRSVKDSSELSMIVDLERNDLGKISVPGSVRVTEHKRLESYPTVFQTISVIRSKKEPNASRTDILRSLFPGGSITGCPKIRAMEIIDELEPTKRGVYTGSIGYIGLDGSMGLNIAIRTMIIKGKDVFFQTGGGIVAASDPEKEYEETLHKARAFTDFLNSPAIGVTVSKET